MSEGQRPSIGLRSRAESYWQAFASHGDLLSKDPEHQATAHGMSMQVLDVDAAVIALSLPASVSSAGHAMKKLRGLDVAVFRVTIRLRVVTKSHSNGKKSGSDFRWIDAPLCQRRPDVSRAFCGAQSGEPERFDWTPRCAQKLAYAAKRGAHDRVGGMLTEPSKCDYTVRTQFATAVTFFHITAVSPVVLDVLAAVEPVQTFAAARCWTVLAGIHLTARECPLALSDPRSQIASATLPSCGTSHPYAPLLWGDAGDIYIFYT